MAENGADFNDKKGRGGYSSHSALITWVFSN